MNAYQDLLKELQETEVVEGLVFSGGEGASEGEIPEELVGKVLSLDEAKSVMLNWSFYGDYGGADCPAAVIWTNHRVIFVGVSMMELLGCLVFPGTPKHSFPTIMEVGK